MNKNKLLLIILLFFSSFSQAINPIILWDIHDVLLQPKNKIITILRYPYLKQLFANFSWPLFKDLAKLIGKELFGSTSSEEFIQAANQHGNPYLAEIVIRYANALEPIPGIPEIVDELADLGLEQQIGSNIGITIFHRLIDSKENPTIAPLFKHMNIGKSKVVSLINGKLIRKPDPRYFEQYLEKNNIDLKKNPVIFIDDRWENVRVAQAMGFDAILFKNQNQLRIELSKRNIPIKKPKFSYSSQRDKYALHNFSSFIKPLPTRNKLYGSRNCSRPFTFQP